jgi:hypothetical protein
MKLLLALILSLAAAAQAQSDFHAYPGVDQMLEGGQVEKITLVCSNLQFHIRPPKKWSHLIDEASRKVVFTSPSGSSAITIQFTSESPGYMPDTDDLHDRTVREHPGAGISPPFICPTGIQPGVGFDLVQSPAPNTELVTRVAYVAQPLGLTEFALAGNTNEYQKDQRIFMMILREFRADVIKPKQPDAP